MTVPVLLEAEIGGHSLALQGELPVLPRIGEQVMLPEDNFFDVDLVTFHIGNPDLIVVILTFNHGGLDPKDDGFRLDVGWMLEELRRLGWKAVGGSLSPRAEG